MRFELAFGGSTQTLEIPDGHAVTVVTPPASRPAHNITPALERSTVDCAAFLNNSRRVLVMVNDATRPTPTASVLSALAPALSGYDVHYLVCTGTHRPPGETELNKIFGPELVGRRRNRIMIHDCRDTARLFFAGRTSFGTPVWFNRELLWADRVITVNSIEPHYFAGYTGGRKGFLPGIAGAETIGHNHNMATHHQSRVFELTGNPVHEDMVEAYRMVNRPCFSIQLVLDQTHRPVAIHHGLVLDSFLRGCRDAHRIFAQPVPGTFDIVVSVLLAPYDINFYQAQRAVEFARAILNRPSVHITVTACPEGIGDSTFIEILRQCSKPSDVFAESNKSHPGWHKAARLATLMESTSLYAVTGLAPSELQGTFIESFDSVQAAWQSALQRIGPNARTCIIPDAGSLVPIAERPS